MCNVTRCTDNLPANVEVSVIVALWSNMRQTDVCDAGQRTQSINNQSIKAHLYSAISRGRIGGAWRGKLSLLSPCIYRGFVFLIQFGINENGKRNHTPFFFQLPHAAGRGRTYWKRKTKNDPVRASFRLPFFSFFKTEIDEENEKRIVFRISHAVTNAEIGL